MGLNLSTNCQLLVLSFLFPLLSCVGQVCAVLCCSPGILALSPVFYKRRVQPQRRLGGVLGRQSASAHRFQRQASPQGHVEKHQGQWLQRPKATDLGELELRSLLESPRKGKV